MLSFSHTDYCRNIIKVHGIVKVLTIVLIAFQNLEFSFKRHIKEKWLMHIHFPRLPWKSFNNFITVEPKEIFSFFSWIFYFYPPSHTQIISSTKTWNYVLFLVKLKSLNGEKQKSIGFSRIFFSLKIRKKNIRIFPKFKETLKYLLDLIFKICQEKKKKFFNVLNRFQVRKKIKKVFFQCKTNRKSSKNFFEKKRRQQIFAGRFSTWKFFPKKKWK